MILKFAKELELEESLIFLGECSNGKFAIASVDSPIIRFLTVDKMTEKNLLMLFSNHDAWITRFNKGVRQKVFDRIACISWIITKSREVGIFDPDKIPNNLHLMEGVGK